MSSFIFDDAAMLPPALSLPSPLIDPARLQALLGAACGRFDVDALADCASTSSLLLERASQGAPAGTVIVADRQSAGRGRRGRTWLSTPQSSLTFSLLWRFEGGVERLAGLSLAVGVAVARALAACGAEGIALKWPNDILFATEEHYAKLGGILVELQADRQNAQHSMLAVIGIGLNLQHLPHLPLPADSATQEAFAYPAGSLDQALSPLPDRHDLLAQLLIELATVLDRFASQGFAALRAEWLARHAWQNRLVRVLHDGAVEQEGLCCGVDSDGALLIKTETGIKRCLSGDVSLRAI